MTACFWTSTRMVDFPESGHSLTHSQLGWSPQVPSCLPTSINPAITTPADEETPRARRISVTHMVFHVLARGKRANNSVTHWKDKVTR